MIVERKRNRDFWLNSLLNSIPDVLLAASAALIFDGGWLVFAGVYFGLQLAYLAIWLKNTLWAWLRYKCVDKKPAVQHIVARLQSNNFPKPEYVFSADEYLKEIVENDAHDVKTRLMAASDIGALDCLKTSMRMQEYLRMSLIYDAALEQYGGIDG